MENLIIEETKYTPYIKLDETKGIFEFKGKSYPENTFEFYKKVLNWVEEYFKEYNETKIIVNLEIVYFNSSSSKMFFDFFDLLEEGLENGHKIEINWFYDIENESALETGEDFKDDFKNLIFNLIEVDSNE